MSELDADAGGIDYDHLNEAAFRDSVDPSEPHFLLGYSTVPGKTNSPVFCLGTCIMESRYPGWAVGETIT
jgi:hypothetical protein